MDKEDKYVLTHVFKFVDHAYASLNSIKKENAELKNPYINLDLGNLEISLDMIKGLLENLYRE